MCACAKKQKRCFVFLFNYIRLVENATEFVSCRHVSSMFLNSDLVKSKVVSKLSVLTNRQKFCIRLPKWGFLKVELEPDDGDKHKTGYRWHHLVIHNTKKPPIHRRQEGSLSASLTYLTPVSNVYSCSGPPTDSTNYWKCVSKFLSTLLANRQWHFKQANHGAHANPGTQVRA